MTDTTKDERFNTDKERKRTDKYKSIRKREKRKGYHGVKKQDINVNVEEGNVLAANICDSDAVPSMSQDVEGVELQDVTEQNISVMERKQGGGVTPEPHETLHSFLQIQFLVSEDTK